MTIDGLPLFEPPRVRHTDSAKARRSAEKVGRKLGSIQRAVIDAYRAHGPMTFTEAEQLPEFERYGRSTIQKRVSELSLAGILERVPNTDSATYRLNESRILNPVEPPRCPTCHRVWRSKGNDL